MSKHNVLLIHPTIQPNGVAYFEENANVFYAPDGQEDTLIRCSTRSRPWPCGASPLPGASWTRCPR